jgi:hypothetical protein
MVLVDKDAVLHLRDKEGKLLPQRVKLETIDNGDAEVELIPMTKGDLTELQKSIKDNNNETSLDEDINLVTKYCVNPKFTFDELKNTGRIQVIQAIVIALMALTTGKSQKEFAKETNKTIAEGDFLQ